MSIEKNNFNPERADALRSYKLRIASQAEQEKERLMWGISNSDLVDYDDEFLELFEDAEGNIVNYLEKELPADAIGIELGGIGSKLFADLRRSLPGRFLKTAGVTLVDNRALYHEDLADDDAKNNHFVIEGDILDNATVKKVKEWTGNSKVQFVIERMIAGLSDLPQDQEFLFRKLNEWYMLVGDDGIMLIELPNKVYRNFKLWSEMINAEYPTLYVRFGQGARGFLLKKGKGAPARLPVLVS